MKKVMLILMASLMLIVFASAIVVNAEDESSVVSPTATVIPDGPTGATSATTGPGGSTSPTSPDYTDITTAKPGETQTLFHGDGDDATGDSTTDETAKPDDSDKSPETGSNGKLLGAAIILVSGMAVAACVDPMSKKSTQVD